MTSTIATYEIRTTDRRTTYPGCERRDATFGTREAAASAASRLIETGEWSDSDLEIVEVTQPASDEAARLAVRETIAAAAEQAGQDIGRGWATAGGESSPDPDYDLSGDGDWQTVREAVRCAAGADADDVWSATDTQPAREWSRLIWDAAEDGYRSALEV